MRQNYDPHTNSENLHTNRCWATLFKTQWPREEVSARKAQPMAEDFLLSVCCQRELRRTRQTSTPPAADSSGISTLESAGAHGPVSPTELHTAVINRWSVITGTQIHPFFLSFYRRYLEFTKKQKQTKNAMDKWSLFCWMCCISGLSVLLSMYKVIDFHSSHWNWCTFSY